MVWVARAIGNEKLRVSSKVRETGDGIAKEDGGPYLGAKDRTQCPSLIHYTQVLWNLGYLSSTLSLCPLSNILAVCFPVFQ